MYNKELQETQRTLSENLTIIAGISYIILLTIVFGILMLKFPIFGLWM